MAEIEGEAADYLIALHTNPDEVDSSEWDDLLARQAQPTPFMGHAYLKAMQVSGSATEATGWAPCWVTLRRGGQLVGATITWLKSHSYGEYVFDWAWADAYQRHGLAYYPKLLCAVPFTPVPGSRFLAVDEASRLALFSGLREVARSQQLSSAHVLYLDDAEQAAAKAAGWMLRGGVQFHWQNRQPEPYLDLTDFLASLQREKRKKIQQERRKVAEAGIQFKALEGTEITDADWDFFHRCYELTYAAHHSTPYLNRDFFSRMAATLPAHWLMFVAEQDGQAVAASLVAIDRSSGVAWGRYWGAIKPVDCLHFEACYYQPLQWCIAQRFVRFEGGAQGEHKMARGLLPVATASAHWLAHPQFARAIEDFLAREGVGVEAYIGDLKERNPFKRSTTPDTTSLPP
ncbi:GNAT family N-acetyltransferase [Ideonella sp.]|uniref:GNAT family N-acetyltransferase n=1 Tax=Ideonella sp. TaxID=1929293 RepID=UPI003BB54049